eukprot:553107-Prymnesium_polylepis.1
MISPRCNRGRPSAKRCGRTADSLFGERGASEHVSAWCALSEDVLGISWASRASCRSRRVRRPQPVTRVRVTHKHAARDLRARLSLLFPARVLGRWPSRVECA